jgi:cyclic dehypoxanthinyl futalosine synthase
VFDMPVRDVLLRLQEAGLDTIPGGGAEILSDRVRDQASALAKPIRTNISR